MVHIRRLERLHDLEEDVKGVERVHGRYVGVRDRSAVLKTTMRALDSGDFQLLDSLPYLTVDTSTSGEYLQ